MTIPKLKYTIPASSYRNQAEMNNIKKTPKLKACRNSFGNIRSKMFACITVVFLFSCLTIMSEAIPRNPRKDHGFHRLVAQGGIRVIKLDYNEEVVPTTNYPNPPEILYQPLRKKHRVRRDLSTFCFQMKQRVCKKLYSDLLLFGRKVKYSNKNSSKRSRKNRVTAARKTKVIRMINQIRSWQKNKQTDIEVCINCERHIRLFRSDDTRRSLPPSYLDIPIPLPENYAPAIPEI